VAARRDGGIEVYDIGNNATLAGYANTTEIPVPAAGWGPTQALRELVNRYQQGRTMLNHCLIDLIGHLSGLSDAQLREIEKSLPATKALIDLLNEPSRLSNRRKACTLKLSRSSSKLRRSGKRSAPQRKF
jgi:hypothetical protein